MVEKIKIGILLAGHSSKEIIDRFGDFDVLFHELLSDEGFSFKTYNVIDMEFPKNIEECDCWLITGSKHSVYDELEFIAPLEEFVRKVYENKRSLVGICFGHQLMAQALGGRVEKFEGGWNLGSKTYESDDKNYNLIAWHQDQVVEKPKEAEVLSTNDNCKYAALIYKDSAFSMQPHPEFNSDYFQALFKKRKDILPQSVISEVENKQILKLDTKYIQDQIKNFFKYRSLTSK